MSNEAVEFAVAYLQHKERGTDGYASEQEWLDMETYLTVQARNLAGCGGPKVREFKYVYRLHGELTVAAENGAAADEKVKAILLNQKLTDGRGNELEVMAINRDDDFVEVYVA